MEFHTNPRLSSRYFLGRHVFIESSKDDEHENNDRVNRIFEEYQEEDVIPDEIKSSIHTLATKDVIKEGEKKLMKMDLPKIRKNTRLMQARFEKFHQVVCEEILSTEQLFQNKMEKCLQKQNNTACPTFREKFRLLKKK